MSRVKSNGVHLIAYADRFGGTLAGLRDVLETEWADVFAGVHVLPCFEPFDGADAGFDPINHAKIDPRLGTWEDLAELANGREVMVDVIVNHISADSPMFRDVMEHGERSSHADLFLTMSSVFPDGAREEELSRIYRPRPGLPFTPYTLGGERRLVWTTFTPQQIDIDTRSLAGREYLVGILDKVAAAGVSTIRLDAAGYAAKDAGTSCFMTSQTYEVIDWLTARAHERGLTVLVEIHSHYEQQVEIAKRVDLVYDFALPPLILHSFYTGDVEPLRRWLHVRPGNTVTVLDTHDGIGVIDVGPDQMGSGATGLLEPAQIDALVEGIHVHTKGESRAATGNAASNLDVYQVNSTFPAALGGDGPAYIAARAIQFFTPGIPQVYYVGAMAGGNDLDLLARSGVGRDINRHHYSREEILAGMEHPTVRALVELARFRHQFPAFDGEFTASGTEGTLSLEWRCNGSFARLDVRPGVLGTTPPEVSVSWGVGDSRCHTDDLINDPPQRGRLP